MNATTPPKHAVFAKTRLANIRRHHSSKMLYLWFKHKGRRYQTSLETDNEELAEVRRDDAIAKIKSGQGTVAAPDAKMTVDQLLTHFLADYKSKIGLVTKDGITDSSFESVECGAKKIRRDTPKWLHQPANKVTAEQFCKPYLNDLGKSTSATTYNRVVDILKRSYAFGMEKLWLASDPTTKLGRATPAPAKSDATLTDDQYRQLIDWLGSTKSGFAPCKYRVVELVEFLRFFGFRINQARHILKSDVEIFDAAKCAGSPIKGQIRVRKEHSKRGKERPDQMFPIIEEALPLITKLLNRPSALKRDKYLLPIGKAYKLLKRAYAALKFPETIKGHHHFRHLAATKWIESGVNIKVVASLLGHSDGGKLALSTYSHVRTNALAHEVGKIKWDAAATTPKPTAPASPQPFTPEQIAAAIDYLNSQNKIVPLPTAA